MGWESFASHQINQVPSKSGVYAWYCDLVLARRDVEDCLSSLKTAPAVEHDRLIGDFLQRRVFDRYREAPYDVRVSGGLKPTYVGVVEHLSHVTSSLTRRIVDHPELLYTIADILRQSIPVFAAPIYIGSATNLRQRLMTHVRLMRKYREATGSEVPEPRSEVDSEVERDHSFAFESMVQRRLDINGLRVFVLSTEVDDRAKLPVEHILNRINYPLCGRN